MMNRIRKSLLVVARWQGRASGYSVGLTSSHPFLLLLLNTRDLFDFQVLFAMDLLVGQNVIAKLDFGELAGGRLVFVQGVELFERKALHLGEEEEYPGHSDERECRPNKSLEFSLCVLA
ncbi:hypothetical protein, variant [Exophiala dermatitidis NIH/UT8656]|uniref:Uncharacterized protein n=1 Tax=Exophiala dermatitidis (strain ATCC 34100 / CBS 525.76 / NIH/UT8656) TaxID=858893 RepID=H6C9E3_EXODN|nr:uncharacterized protein HMPREF1120_08661 [Exophiala dermatitidis NIH/UT8656]XP_009161174.1 hypothetical protein, variant [Exophiala dermatitidis NIH/UT8656]EHY60712.1 hypothetical protein, variant [Exophiala dermatitidis NIH/UT8656]EHY60713.1 hypothetical protein HMPREF1120_08661 [Exophiala dermatitidis NIH/UT8656]